MRLQHKTAERQAVEACIIDAGRDGINPREIAGNVGISLDHAQRCISAIVKAGQAHNLNQGHRGSAVLVWGPAKVVHNVIDRHIPTGTYTGQPAAATRPGAMDFLSLPSLIEGQCVERRRPMLIA